MKALVLGGCGIQGRAALYDLSRNPSVEQIIFADIQPDLIHSFDVVLDFLPPQYILIVAEAVITSGVHLVNTNYAYGILDLDTTAKEKGIAIVPECGLDPGIDLVIYHYGLLHFGEVYKINSYCRGIPEKPACDNSIKFEFPAACSAG